MKATFTQQEILLVKTSGYLCREWAEKKDNGEQQPQTEKLEEACWNGLIRELLPEVFDSAAPANKMYLWQVKDGDNLLQLELSEDPIPVERHFSIDPQSFLAVQDWN